MLKKIILAGIILCTLGETMQAEAATVEIWHVGFHVVTPTATQTPTPTATATSTATPALTMPATCTSTPNGTSTPESTVVDHYIYILDPQKGLTVYEAANPNQLLLVLPPWYFSWHIYIHDHYAYLVDGHGTMEVKDISLADAPRHVSRRSTGGEALGVSGYQHWVLVADGGQGVVFYDAAMPADMRLVKRVNTSKAALDVDVNEQARQATVLLSDHTYLTLDLSDYTTASLFPGGGYATPNPFLPLNGQRTFFNFRFEDSGASYAIRIYDLRGQLQRTLSNTREWDGRSEAGHLCEGGVYVYQIEAGGKRVSGKVVLVK